MYTIGGGVTPPVQLGVAPIMHTHTHTHTHTAHTLHTHTAHTHSVHSVHWYTHCVHTLYTLYTHCTHTLHTPTHTAYTQHIRTMCIHYARTTHTHTMHTHMYMCPCVCSSHITLLFSPQYMGQFTADKDINPEGLTRIMYPKVRRWSFLYHVSGPSAICS